MGAQATPCVHLQDSLNLFFMPSRPAKSLSNTNALPALLRPRAGAETSVKLTAPIEPRGGLTGLTVVFAARTAATELQFLAGHGRVPG